MRQLLFAMLFAAAGAHAICPDGAQPDASLGFCVKGVDAYGPFTKAMTDACIAAGAGSSCTATLAVPVDGVTQNLQRWSKAFAQSLRGTAACPRGSSPSGTHDGRCLETVGTTKNLYAIWNAPLTAKCRFLGNGSACHSNRWAAGVYLSVRDAQPRVGWTAPGSLNSALPFGLQVFQGSGTVNSGGTAFQATVLRLEPVNAPQLAFDVLFQVPNGALTPQQFSQGTPRRWAVMNGGYFSGSPAVSASLLVQGASLVSRGFTGLSRNGKTYYPTRAAFGETAGGGFEAVWAYPASSGLFQYPQPAALDTAQPPLPEPSASFPANASPWAPVNAVGGGPMLVKGGVAQNTAATELFDAASGVAPASPAPRSAIGRTASGALLMLVVDGRSEFSGGITLSDLATLLRSLGAVDAINLDGGGSSAMVVNGALATRPSDAGGQRAVHSVVVVRER